ncbi:hypothetical protein JCM10212_000045, partial [Sporobolomyces blumeae]
MQTDDSVQMTSRLPGDAHDSSPSRSPSPPSSSATPAAPPRPPSPRPSASASPKTYELVSVSATDPSKRRTFSCEYLLPPTSDFASSSSRSFLDLPESYFNPTPTELQQAFAGQVKKREDLVDKPLLTQKLRDREEAHKNRAKAARWPHTRIRIRFADRSQLEGVFPSTDKLVHLYEFVRLAIAPEHRHTPFVL